MNKDLKYHVKKICKKPGINKQRLKKRVVNVLSCERSEPGFEPRRPESDFTPMHQKTEEKSAAKNTPAATSTVPSDNFSGQGPTTTPITHI